MKFYDHVLTVKNVMVVGNASLYVQLKLLSLKMAKHTLITRVLRVERVQVYVPKNALKLN